MVDISNRRAPGASGSVVGSKANGSAVPFHPTSRGVTERRSGDSARSATPPCEDNHLYPLHTTASADQWRTLTGPAPANCVASTMTRQPTSLALAVTAATWTELPVPNCTALKQTALVLSPMARTSSSVRSVSGLSSTQAMG